MHRITAKRLMAFIVSMGACLALAGSPALFSAQGAADKAGSQTINPKSAPAAKVTRSGKSPAAASKPRAGSARKRTTGASQTSVSGTTTDGSGHGWALYSQLTFTSASTEPLTVFSDPVTGQYQATLFNGIDYTVAVTAVSPGYGATGTDFTTDGAPLVQDWSLQVDAVACNAIGYSLSVNGLSEGFDGGVLPDGWNVTNDSEDGGFPWSIWTGADPCGQFPGNDTGGTGPYGLVNSNCDFLVTDDTSLVTPSVDLTTVTSAQIRWNNDYVDLESIADVDLSTNGGDTWTNVWERAGVSEPGPGLQSVDIPDAVGQANVQVRFHYTGFFAWWWQVDNVILGQASCLPNSGGLIVGNVFDGNTGAGINGATVANLTSSGSATSFDPGDPDREPGFYMMFSPAGPQSLQATKAGYAADAHGATAFNNDVVRSDFTLQAGLLDASPRPVSAVINSNGLADKTLTLTNSGEPDVHVQIIEINAPLLASSTAGFATKTQRQTALARLPKDSKGRPIGDAKSAVGLAPFSGAPAHRAVDRPLDAVVLATYPSQIAYGWGVATAGTDVWLSNIAVAGGDDKDYQYHGDGTKTGNTIDDSVFLGAGGWAADGAFNPNTGMMWRVAVAGDDCLHELDPVTKTVTGNTICGTWTLNSQRGVAYDASTDTYFVGGWNEGVIYHIDNAGNILDSSFVALSIAALAYNANDGHLLVMQSIPTSGDEIAVLDALNNYAMIGSITVPGMTAGGGAGMEFDCLGNLWVVDQLSQTIIELASGENPPLCSVDIPWLTVNPTEGTVPGVGSAPANTLAIDLTFNSTGMLPGLRQGQLQFGTDTPYAVAGVPVALTVLFNDVPENSFAWNFIYGIAGANIMFGGPPTCPAGIFSFCPNGVVTRADMAGYIFRAVHGPTTPPPVYTNEYGDVTFNQYNAFYIQGITDDGITAGCGSGNYCPDSPNTRAQMSVFIWKGQHGDQAPDACTPEGAVFTDVPCGSFAADYIYGLFNEGVTAGCGSGNFCPNANITNAQMAVFLVKGFNIPFLP